jgi:hypothetical protein
MTLFGSDPQYREKLSIIRIFSLLPLFSELLSGCVCRWFAVNMPMTLGKGGDFAGDIDVFACLKRWPNDLSPWPNGLAPWPSDTPKKGFFYRTWEVKVAKFYKDGQTKSLKRGKVRNMMSQLDVHRKFGSPNVALLDVCLCQPGLLGQGTPPFPPSAQAAILERLTEVRRDGFGYQLLVFGHEDVQGDDVGLLTVSFGVSPFLRDSLELAFPAVTTPRDPFASLASEIDRFWETNHTAGPFQQMVVFCSSCNSLKIVSTKTDTDRCPDCGDDLVAQS